MKLWIAAIVIVAASAVILTWPQDTAPKSGFPAQTAPAATGTGPSF